MLAETFGPQYRQVVAFVRRCAVTTEQEAEALAKEQVPVMGVAQSALWNAARVAERTIAVDAAWTAARDAAWTAAGAAAWTAARDAAWTAAWDAASAIAVADLVGQSGLTQEHIDILLHPVRAVLGDPLDDNTVAEWLEIR